MARYKKYSYEQTKFIPVSFSRQILEGTFEYTLNHIIDNEVDLDVFASDYKNDETGAPAWDPAIMLKIILYAYSKGIIHSRKIAQCCRENVIFMALSADSCPHFTTIANFVSCMEAKILPLFRNILLVCSELNLIGGDMFALDGCKLSSNASKELSGTHADLLKKKQNTEKILKKILKQHRKRDIQESGGKPVRRNQERRINKIKAKIRKIDRFLAENEKRIGGRGKEKKSNVTDNESAKMKSSHGIIQGYNGLSMVDSKHQVVVYAGAFGENSEVTLLSPCLEDAKSNMEHIGKGKDYFKGRKLVADTGFSSEANYKSLAEDDTIDGYIPDPNFRRRDPRLKSAKRYNLRKRKQYSHEDFTHDESCDEYICPAGKRLKRTHRDITISGNISGNRYQASRVDCCHCDKKKKCLRGTSRQRTLFISKRRGINYTSRMMAKIDSKEGRAIYDKRIGTIEPVFGNICYAMGMNRFTLRGKSKVNIQWVLYNIVHNLGKINKYGIKQAA
jgi:transposase